MMRRCGLMAASALLLLAAATMPAAAGQKKVLPTPPGSLKAVADDQVCLQHIRSEEKAHRIPGGLLAAIGLTESGRAIKRGQRIVWPWTVNAAGEGHYFESKADAIAFVEGKLADGVESIDVGCMQINLKHHPDAFASLEDAFDPATNAAYGADFLTALHAELNGWLAAARRYHSATPEKGEAYGARVLANWTGPAKEKELAAAETADTAPAQAAPADLQVATAAGFLRATPVRATADGNLSLFSQFYTPAALSQAETIKAPVAKTQVAAAQLQQGPGQTTTDGRNSRFVSTQKVFQRRVAPGQTGLSLKDYRAN
jgi:Transglycosylase SLT domain